MRTRSITSRTRFLPVAALGVVALLAGCAQQGLRGYVTTSGISTVIVTGENDARVSEPGITGATVEVYSPTLGGPPRLYGSAVSGTDGSFRIPVDRRDYPRGELQVVAEHEGFVTARRTVQIPRTGEIWLVLLEPRTTAPALPGSAAEPPAAPARTPE